MHCIVIDTGFVIEGPCLLIGLFVCLSAPLKENDQSDSMFDMREMAQQSPAG